MANLLYPSILKRETKRERIRLIIKLISNFLILFGFILIFLASYPFLSAESGYYWRQLWGVHFKLGTENKQVKPSFASLLQKPSPIAIEPVSRDFGIVIEEIGVNAPVLPNVDVSNYQEYMQAMHHGVAHAKGTVMPGEIGNSYLFAHSTLNFWQFGPYATVFTLLRKLERGDRIVIFYKGEQKNFYVVNKEIVNGFNLKPLLRQFKEPVITLQTCDPPGTTWRRLIITAKQK